jgi:hypothetical protein
MMPIIPDLFYNSIVFQFNFHVQNVDSYDTDYYTMPITPDLFYHGREKYSASPPKSIKLWNIRTFDKIVIETLHLNQNGPNYEK